MVSTSDFECFLGQLQEHVAYEKSKHLIRYCFHCFLVQFPFESEAVRFCRKQSLQYTPIYTAFIYLFFFLGGGGARKGEISEIVDKWTKNPNLKRKSTYIFFSVCVCGGGGGVTN